MTQPIATLKRKRPAKASHLLTLKKARKQQAAKRGQTTRNTDDTLLTRTTPKTLMDVVRDIRKSPSKIQAVREIGFGEVVHFPVDELPLKLAFWLVNNFDETTCEVALPGACLKVTQDDVQMVFGIPKGSQTLSHDLKRAILTKGLVAKWREHHGTTKALISPAQIKQKIVEDEEAGLGFKLDFLVLFCDRVIESNTNNFVKHSFLNSISNVDMIADIN
uniref:Uncharacterized protein n=1 Tax=Kalanchoe fedtschenkoi TaxID=63787 RepID=A0A7N0UZD2_KALFE